MGNSPVQQRLSTQTIAALDIQRYEGAWYEVASIPKSYEISCDRSIAFYIQTGPDTIHIVNYCVSGRKVTSIEGTATVENSLDPGKLKVNFEGIFSQRGNYWIYDTDYTSYSIVGGGNLNSLWILSRTKSLDETQFRKIREKIVALGYKPELLVTKLA